MKTKKVKKNTYTISHDGYFGMRAKMYKFEGTEEELMEHLGYGKTCMDDWEADEGTRPTLEFMKEQFELDNGGGGPFYQVLNSKGKQIMGFGGEDM